MYDGRIGFDPVYTGNWPKGSKLGAMKEGERLLRNPQLMGKDVGFLGNHGTMQISSSIEEALFDCFNLERLARLQVFAVISLTNFHSTCTPSTPVPRELESLSAT